MKRREQKTADPVAVARTLDQFFAARFPNQRPPSYYDLARMVQEQTSSDFRTAAEAVLEARPEAEWKLVQVQIP